MVQRQNGDLKEKNCFFFFLFVGVGFTTNQAFLGSSFATVFLHIIPMTYANANVSKIVPIVTGMPILRSPKRSCLKNFVKGSRLDEPSAVTVVPFELVSFLMSL